MIVFVLAILAMIFLISWDSGARDHDSRNE